MKVVFVFLLAVVGTQGQSYTCDYSKICAVIQSAELRDALVAAQGSNEKQKALFDCPDYPGCGVFCGGIKGELGNLANAIKADDEVHAKRSKKRINKDLKKKCHFTEPIKITCKDGSPPPCTEPFTVELTNQVLFKPGHFACNGEADHVATESSTGKTLDPSGAQIIQKVADAMSKPELKSAECTVRGYFWYNSKAKAGEEMSAADKKSAKCRAQYIADKINKANPGAQLTAIGHQYGTAPYVDLACKGAGEKVARFQGVQAQLRGGQ